MKFKSFISKLSHRPTVDDIINKYSKSGSTRIRVLGADVIRNVNEYCVYRAKITDIEAEGLLMILTDKYGEPHDSEVHPDGFVEYALWELTDSVRSKKITVEIYVENKRHFVEVGPESYIDYITR